MKKPKRDAARSLRELPGPLAEDASPIERLTVEDLDESAEWLRVVASATNLGIFVHDRDHVLWVNRAVERMTGYSREELLRAAPLDLVAPDARVRLDERWQERLRRRDTTPRRYEVRFRRKDGTERWVELSLSTIEYRGKLAGLGTVFDVTERKEAAQALRASEERLQLAQQAGDIIVWDWDIPTDRLFYSAHAKNLFDLGPEESTTIKGFLALVHPQDLPRLESALEASLEEDRDYFVEHRLVLATGQTRWLAARGKVVRDTTGQATRMLGVSIDVTHRKLAEEALFQEKERAQVTLASIGDGVIRTDVRGMIDYMNPAAERLTGWPIHEAYGKHLRDVFQVIDPETHTMLLDPVTRCLAEGRYVEFPGERMLQPRDGLPVAVRDSASPIVSRQGRTVGAVLAFKDVSELRQMERERSFLSTHDPLTGLLNRKTFEEEVERVVRRVRDGGPAQAVLFLDLDQFKMINDSSGHFAGDETAQDGQRTTARAGERSRGARAHRRRRVRGADRRGRRRPRARGGDGGSRRRSSTRVSPGRTGSSRSPPRSASRWRRRRPATAPRCSPPPTPPASSPSNGAATASTSTAPATTPSPAASASCSGSSRSTAPSRAGASGSTTSASCRSTAARGRRWRRSSSACCRSAASRSRRRRSSRRPSAIT